MSEVGQFRRANSLGLPLPRKFHPTPAAQNNGGYFRSVSRISPSRISPTCTSAPSPCLCGTHAVGGLNPSSWLAWELNCISDGG